MAKGKFGFKWLLLACAVMQLSLASATTSIEQLPDKAEEDSTSNYKRKVFKKNSVRLDLLGKSVLFGFAYDRIVYHKEFDIHANVGLFPVQLFNAQEHSINLALYYSSTDKEKWNYVAGFAYNYSIAFSSEVTVTHYTRQFYGIMAGFHVDLHERWDAQLLWTPAIGYKREHFNGGSGGGFVNGPFGSPLFWSWGGVNIGYKF